MSLRMFSSFYAQAAQGLTWNMNMLTGGWSSLMYLSLISSLCATRQTSKNIFRDGENLAQKIKETKWVCWRAHDTQPLVPAAPRGQIHSRVQRTRRPAGGNSEIPDFGILHEMTLPDSAPHWRDAEEIVTWKDWNDSFPADPIWGQA